MLLFALFLTMASVSADDSNQTDVAVINNDSDYGSVIEDDSGSYSATNLSQANQTTSPLKASFDAVEKENYIKNKTFSVKLLDENRKGLANKTVQFTLDGKVFNSITDKNGNAKLTLNVDKGTYTVKYSFNEVGYKAVKGSKKILVIGSTASKIAASDFTAYSTIIN